MDAVIIRVIDLPHGVGGMTVKDSNDDYNIYLNARLSGDAQVVAFRHELDHIRKGDFFSEDAVRDIERRNPF